jgi:hypothetical protein
MVAAVGLSACTGDEPGGAYGPPTCDGGGEPLIEIGSGGQLGFEPFAAGELVPVRPDGETIEVQLWTSGLDTTDSMIVTIRTSIAGGASKDSTASFTLVCNDEEGRGWLGAYPFLPDEAEDGDLVTVVATATDGTDVSGRRLGG